MITSYVNPWRMGGWTRMNGQPLGSVAVPAGIALILEELFPTDEKGAKAELETAIETECARRQDEALAAGDKRAMIYGIGGVALGLAVGLSVVLSKKKR